MAIITALMDRNFIYYATDIGRLFRKRLDCVARPSGITTAQLRALLVLRREPGANQAALAGFLEVEPITAGRMIDRMVAAGLVERQADPTDRRVWRLFPTELGRTLLAEMDDELGALIETALDGLDRDERASVTDALERVRQNLIEEGESRAVANG
ncbi:MarR family transcriptional regulator [Croceicoccus sp. BE223]|uniref:MarR family winged helix-turn-helix transcriptional regulator n=1 Tax=Croceicoccus sp. BE223 TaxID=2817716 RepID=UPI00285F19A8|nr:MarR family transcriptional regulator [Croceicoccus sp. BE223]MDR7102106.1 DNA-binding MarR family transcriptional regulator [Croceicoccus sp. BE223]